MKIQKDICRKHMDCESCVTEGCMYPGYSRFPCRKSWDDMEGTFPYNPPPVTKSDCFDLENRHLIPSNPASTTTSIPTQECPTQTSTAVVVLATLAVVVLIWGLWNVGKIVWRYYNRRMNFANVQYRGCVEDSMELD